jgi:hypothetical protein
MMRKTVCALALALLFGVLAAGNANAQVTKFGMGAIIGEPTGIDGKFFLSGRNAIEGAVAWSLSGNNDLHLQGDYLYHWYDWIEPKEGRMPVIFGIGARVEFRENQDDLLGIRFPIGVAYEMADAPFDFFGQIVPILELTPDTDFDLEGAFGARFWF